MVKFQALGSNLGEEGWLCEVVVTVVVMELVAHVMQTLQRHHTGTTLQLCVFHFLSNPAVLSYHQSMHQTLCPSLGFIIASPCTYN